MLLFQGFGDAFEVGHAFLDGVQVLFEFVRLQIGQLGEFAMTANQEYDLVEVVNEFAKEIGMWFVVVHVTLRPSENAFQVISKIKAKYRMSIPSLLSDFGDPV